MSILNNIFGPNVDKLKMNRDIESLIKVLNEGNMFAGEQQLML
ncbi:hypothetical protein [Methanobacterium sp.]